MRLLKLRANKESFKTVPFNPEGVSIIVGKRHNQDYSANRKSTYNSVGKSLTIALVHFCLGSNKNEEFETKLNDWEFYLDFEIEGESFTAKRTCSNQQVVFLNDKELTLDEYKDLLAAKAFNLSEPQKNLTFRSLISRFIRPRKGSYISYSKYIDEENDYQRLVANSFLLGLDTKLISKKLELKEELDKVDSMKKSIEKDPIMKSFFSSEEDKNFEIDIVDLKGKIKRLERSLSTFEIAEDYYDIVREADEIKQQLKSHENKASTIKSAISNIEKSLNIQPDIPKKKVIELYQEAQYTLPEAIVKRLEEVERFNKKILDNRSSRLISEKRSFETKLREIEVTIAKLGKLKDEKLEYLNTRGALDEFTKLNEQLGAYRSKLENIEKFRKLIGEYKNKQEELKQSFSEQNITTNNYLKDQQTLIEENILLFRSFAEEFYSNKKAGIEINNNEGVNRQRFDIKAKIDDDKGDGVGAVKIFCFDWTILKGRHNHKVNFLFHDSRLLSEMDPRQVATLFQVAYTNTQNSGLQYIISTNQNVVEQVLSYMSDEDYKKIIVDSIILELTDESNESKLLGMQLDLDYDKERN